MNLCSLQEFDPPLREGDQVIVYDRGDLSHPIELVIKKTYRGELFAAGITEYWSQHVRFSQSSWYKRKEEVPFKEEDWL